VDITLVVAVGEVDTLEAQEGLVVVETDQQLPLQAMELLILGVVAVRLMMALAIRQETAVLES
jgi:hypothetical protein